MEKNSDVLKSKKSEHKISPNWFAYLNAKGPRSKSSEGSALIRRNIAIPRNTSNGTKPVITKVLSLDCEMVSDYFNQDMLGRVSIVNYRLEVVYDKFVKPTSKVGDYRTRYSGLRPSDLVNGVEFKTVKKEVEDLLKNKLLVGHALENDFKVLNIEFDEKFIRDTSKFKKFVISNNGRTPSLKRLASSFLGEIIQKGEHSSVEDAITAMKLYIKYRHEWEMDIMNRT